jgi:DNA-binding Lrp family transcriptional regulator
MVRAYVLVQARVGAAGGVAKLASSIAGVSAADALAGPYDAILTVDGASIDEIASLVVSKVQTIEGVNRTITCPVVHW